MNQPTLETRNTWLVIMLTLLSIAQSMNAATVTSNLTLDQDLEIVIGNGLYINGSNIIIDGAGHSIIFTGTINAAANGISMANGTNVTIKNVTIKGFNVGLSDWGSGTKFIDSRIENCVKAAVETFGTNLEVRRCVLKNNQHTFYGAPDGSQYADNLIIGGRTLLTAFAGQTPTLFNNHLQHLWKEGPIRFDDINRTWNIGDSVSFTAHLYNFQGSLDATPTATIRTVPEEAVTYNTNGSTVTGSFQPSRNGLYSIIARSTDLNGNITERAQRIYVGATANRSLEFYINDKTPTHGQTINHTPEDSRGMELTPIPNIGFNECGGWIQQSPDQLPPSPVAFMTRMDLHFRMKFDSDAEVVMGVQRNVTYNLTTDKKVNLDQSLGTGEYIMLDRSFTNLKWMMDYPHEWYYLSSKFYGRNPWMETGNPESMSKVDFHYKVPLSPEMKSSSNHDILILGATTDPNDPNFVKVTVSEMENGDTGELVFANFSHAILQAPLTISPAGTTATLELKNLNGELTFNTVGLIVDPTGGNVVVHVSSWPTIPTEPRAWTELSQGDVSATSHIVAGLTPSTTYEVLVNSTVIASEVASTSGELSFDYLGAFGNQALNFEVRKRSESINLPPSASFTATPTVGAAPLDVQLDASSSTDDNGIISFVWDFGDQNTGTGISTSHTFSSSGTFTITLTVTDAAGLSNSTSQTIEATASELPPGTVHLIAMDQFGQSVTGAEIKIRELNTWYPTGSQIQLTVGDSYRIRGRISNVQGGEVWHEISNTTSEIIVPFWTTTLIAEDQYGSDVNGAQIRVRNYYEEWFTSGQRVSLPKEYTAQVTGKVSNANGPTSNIKFTDGLTTVRPAFHSVTLIARDQFGTNVTNAQIRVRYYFDEWFTPGASVTLPQGYTAQVYGKVSNLTGPRTNVPFEANLSEIDPTFWTFTVRTRDQFGAIVPDGQAQIRYLGQEKYSDGEILTVPKDDVIGTKSRRKSLANSWVNETFTDGLDIFEATFRSVLFKAVGTDGMTLVPNAEIDLYTSQIARFPNNSLQSVPVPDTVRVRVYKDSILIADLNPATFEEGTSELIIQTSYEVTGGNTNPTIDSPPTATPNPAEVGALITFTVAASDNDNDTLSYQWTFGDGTNGAGSTATHAYGSTGTHTVGVTVTDGRGGSETSTFNVIVKDTQGPQLNVSNIILKGTVSDVSGIASLNVHGQATTIQSDGSWQQEITLTSTTTNVQVEATDEAGNTSTQTIAISR